jgi:nucleotide-binding universal stress UspA family protein
MVSAKSLRKILVPVDGSNQSVQAAQTAARLAKKTRRSVTVLHVLPYDMLFGKLGSKYEIPHSVLHELQRRVEREGERIVGDAVAVFKEEGVPVETQTVRSKHPADTILVMSREDYGLIIMGAHGEEEKDPRVLGSVARNVMRHAACPTLVTKGASALSNLLVCLDGSDYSIAALDLAADLAEKMGSKITLLNVQEPRLHQLEPQLCSDLGEKIVSEALTRIKRKGLTADKEVECGVPSDVIVEVAEKGKHDLIVLGHKGLGDLKRFLLGDVSDDVSYKAKCSVLIVPRKH